MSRSLMSSYLTKQAKTRWGAAILALLVVMTACSGDSDEPQRGHQPAEFAPSISPKRNQECPNEEAAIAASRPGGRGRLHGDVDGDGKKDDIFLVYDENGHLGCQAFLIIETGQRTRSTSISDWEDLAFVPELGFLREIDGRPGREIVVHLGAGASTNFYGLFTWKAAGPHRIHVRGWVGRADSGIHDSTGDDLIGHGASSGHASTVDCAPGGMVLISSAFPKNGPAGTNPYLVQRRFYRSRHGPLVLARTETEERPYDAYAKDFWEFRSRAFQHCRMEKRVTAERRDRSSFAIWPQDTYSEAAAACSRAAKLAGRRSDQILFAKQFVSQVLGWRRARIVDTGAAAGTFYATVSRGRRAGVGGKVVLGIVDVVTNGPLDHLWKEGGSGCLMLSVLEPPPPSGRGDIDVRVRGRAVSVHFESHGARSARVIIGYGRERELTKTVTGSRAAFRLPSKPDRAGHLMVLLLDDSGKVFTASGIKLVAGNLTYRR